MVAFATIATMNFELWDALHIVILPTTLRMWSPQLVEEETYYCQLSGVTEGSSQINTWPAVQMSPGPLGGV